MKIGAQPTILPVGPCGKIGAGSYFPVLLSCTRNKPWPSSGCFVTQLQGCEQKPFLSPVQGAQAQAALPALCCPQWLRKPLSSIYTTPDASRETLKLFWKETILTGPIFRLYKAHVRFLLSLSLSTLPAVWKATGSFVFKRSAPTGSNLWALECSGVCLPSFWPKPQVMTFTPEELS